MKSDKSTLVHQAVNDAGVASRSSDETLRPVAGIAPTGLDAPTNSQEN